MNDHREIPVNDGTNRTGSANYGNNSSNNNPYVHMSPAPHSSTSHNRMSGFQRNNSVLYPNLFLVSLKFGVLNSGPNPMDAIYDGFNRCSRSVEKATKHAELMVDNLWNHIRMSTSVADAAVARIVQGTKALTNGGHDKLFQQTFGFIQGEKLLKAYACYISTTTGPVIGTLYISTKRLAFCSDYPLCHHPFSIQHNCIYYKVVVQLEQINTVVPSANLLNPAEKYIHVVTVDGYEFYFMGFISYDKALKTIIDALQQYRNHSNGNQRFQHQ